MPLLELGLGLGLAGVLRCWSAWALLGAARIGLYFYLNVLVCFMFPCAPVFVGIFLFEGRADEKGIWKDDYTLRLFFYRL